MSLPSPYPPSLSLTLSHTHTHTHTHAHTNQWLLTPTYAMFPVPTWSGPASFQSPCWSYYPPSRHCAPAMLGATFSFSKHVELFPAHSFFTWPAFLCSSCMSSNGTLSLLWSSTPMPLDIFFIMFITIWANLLYLFIPVFVYCLPPSVIV